MLTMRPNLTHLGIFTHNAERMSEFYASVFDLRITDRGVGAVFKNNLIFMSGDATKHHQLVISSGRPPEATFSTVMQISFTVGGLADLREIRRRALASGAYDLIGLDHGNAWSIYFKDPEGNTVEVYVDTPYHVTQPHGDPLDLDLADAEIMRRTEASVRADPSYEPREDYVKRMINSLTE